MKKIIIVTLIIVLALFYFVYNNRYVPFYPVKYENDKYFVDKYNIPKNYYDNLQQVLIFNDINFKIEDKKIYVKYILYKDMDLCYNFSKKANDPRWFVLQKLNFKK